MLLLALLALFEGDPCLQAVKKHKAAIVLLESRFCTGCLQVKRMLRDLKSEFPEGTTTCCANLVKFQESLKRKPDREVPNYALFRNGKLITVVAEEMTNESLLRTLRVLRDPPIERIQEGTEIESDRVLKTVVFRGDEEDEQFAEAAILFRNYPVRFLWERGEFGVSVLDNVKKRTTIWRGYPESIVEWIEKLVNLTRPMPFHRNNSALFLAVGFGVTSPDTDDFFDYLSDGNIPESVVLGYANWDRDAEMLKNCSISPNERTFVLIKPNGMCYPFVDDDVVSSELLKIFIHSVMRGMYDKRAPVSGTEKRYGLVSPLNGASIADTIPNPKICTMLHIYSESSLSTPKMQQMYATLARRFSQKNFRFYEMDTRMNWRPTWIPNNDGFPMLATWAPGDRRPNIYRGIMTLESLTKWIHATAYQTCNLTMI